MRAILSRPFRIGLISLAALTTTAVAQADDVNDLIEGLSANLPSDRVAAADELARLDDDAVPATSALIGALSDDDEHVRWHAARALGAIGAPAAESVPALSEALSDEKPMVRAHAARALGEIGDSAGSTFETLVKMLVDPEPVVRRAAMSAARELSPGPEAAVTAFAKLLADSDPAIVVVALEAIIEQGDKAVPMLNEALKNKETEYWACVGLTELGAKAAPAVPNLIEIVSHEEEEVRLQAMLALAEIGEAARPGTPELIEALADPQVGVRYAAAFALGSIQAEGADDALEQASETDDKFLGILTAWALARTNPDDDDRQRTAVTQLLAGIHDEDEQTRAASIRALAQLDPPEDMRDTVIKEIMASPYPEVMPAALDAVAARGAVMVERISQRLADPETRIHAVRVLARMGPEAKDAVPELVAALADSEPELGGEINFALGAIGPDAKEAVPALQALVNDENDSLRYSAVFALGEIGPNAKPAGRALIANLRAHKEGDPFLTLASAWALSRIYPDSPNAAKTLVPILVTGLKHERPNVRMETARALGDIGKEAKSATDALREALDDPDDQVRSAAAEALDKIE